MHAPRSPSSLALLLLCATACTTSHYRELRLENTESLYDVRAFIADGGLQNVSDLDLRNCDGHLGQRGWGPDIAQLIARDPDAQHIEALDLSCHSLSDAGLDLIARSPHLIRLETLILESDEIHTLDPLSQAQALARLHTLRLDHNPLAGAAFSQLAHATTLPALREISLRSVALTSHIRDLTQGGPLLQQLTHLELAWSGDINDHAAHLLSRSPAASQLRQLGLQDTHVTDVGLRDLARSPFLARLQHLDLRDLDLRDEGLIALSRSPYMRSLQRLDLRGVNLSEAAALALADSEQLNPHIAISLDAERTPPAALKALKARYLHLDIRRPENPLW